MDFNKYKEEYKESTMNTTKYWGDKGRALLTWDKEFTEVFNSEFDSSVWYRDGKLNACYNCIDRHVEKNPDKVAMLYTDNDNNIVRYTYKDCLEYICRVAEVLKNKGLQKGDCVAVYMAMCPEAVFSVLACARLGLVHNVIFGGFSSNSVVLRMEDSKAKFLITCDVAKRAKSSINFWENVEKVLESKKVSILLFNTDKNINSKDVDIIYWSDVLQKEYKFIDCVSVDSEDVLFYLYTSGSTGRPKGMIHTTAGYLVYASLTAKVCFDLRKDDVFACTADIGWITGHTYSVYGPLLNGSCTVIFGGTPVYPDYYRLFSLVEDCKITQLYTAPTVIRTLMKYFNVNPFDRKFNLSSLRLLGSVGEPINEEAYRWFSKSFNNLHVVDTYWQTETGGIMIAPFPNTLQGKPECASLPFFGIQPVIVKEGSSYDNIQEAEDNELGQVVFKKSWPGISRGVLNDQKRYRSSYFRYKGCYVTGDEGYRDAEGLFWIRGRADDVINVSGHRLSTAELESAACTDINVAESAVIAVDDEITGQALVFFVVLKTSVSEQEAKDSLKKTLRSKIGRLVHPKDVHICKEGLPKTATGKIMRRVLRDIHTGIVSEDLSTCINTESIDAIRSLYSCTNAI
ncbi:hypothetical protein P3W45_001639 [Vairimorpha bombi]|jgi:acetyl-CoA synthetase